jgi:hypothetical protein
MAVRGRAAVMSLESGLESAGAPAEKTWQPVARKFDLQRHETNIESMLVRYARRAAAVRPWIAQDDVVLDIGCGRQVFREVVKPRGYIGCDLLAYHDNVVCDLDSIEDFSFAKDATVAVLLGVLAWLEAPYRLLGVVAGHRFPRVILSAPAEMIEPYALHLESHAYARGRQMSIPGTPTHLIELRR